MSSLIAASGFTGLDWAVVLGILGLTTWIGHRLAGKPASMRDFFLGGRRLPWYAVAASIAATEISAVTFLSLPWAVAGGDMTYLQMVLIGSVLTRLMVGYWLVPAYYKREIYSPYDYIGERLGESARKMTTGLFTVGGILGQSVRVYMTALLLEVLMPGELAWLAQHTGLSPMASAVLFFTLIAVAWTWMGGIATVVWTDAILFLLFLAGIAVALVTVHLQLEGGLGAALDAGNAAGKTRWFSLSTRLEDKYTLWTALALFSWSQIGAYGCDQLMAQRLFCCKDAREARRAIVASSLVGLVVVACALVGVALFAYYQAHPEQGDVMQLKDRLFPTFIADVIAPGLKGVVVAGALAAAISSLDSILAALSQTTLSTFFKPADDRTTLRRSRALVLGWGVVLAAATLGIQLLAERWDSILSMALSVAGFTQGALLAGFLLAFLPLRPRTRGFLLGAPISVAVVVSVWHWSSLPWPWFVPIGCVTTLAVAFAVDRPVCTLSGMLADRWKGRLRDALLGILVTAASIGAAECLLWARGVQPAVAADLGSGFDPEVAYVVPDGEQPECWNTRIGMPTIDKVAIPAAGQAERVLLFGGSNTAGFRTRNLARLLNATPGGTEFEVFNLGRSGYGSGRVAILFEQALDKLQPDVVLLYAGHNEFVERSFRAELEYWDQGWVSSVARLSQHSRVVRLLRDVAIGRRPAAHASELRWRTEYGKFMGMEYSATLAEFERYAANMRRMVELARARGVRVVLSTVVFNRFSSPRVSTPGPEVTSAQRAEFAELRKLARAGFPAYFSVLLPPEDILRLRKALWGRTRGDVAIPFPGLRPLAGPLAGQQPLFPVGNREELVDLLHDAMARLNGPPTAEERTGLLGSAAHLDRALTIIPDHAATLFQRGLVGWALGERGEDVRAWLEDSARFDRAPRRATPLVNDHVRAIAGEHSEVELVDLDELMRATSEDGLVGWELMLDHCHLGPLAYDLALQTFTQAILERWYPREER